jgi:hypothetical protein
LAETSLWPLQVAIVQRLESDAALNAVIKGVFDGVEKGQKFPYVTVGDPTMVPFETKSSFGEETTVVLHCWSQHEAGKEEAYKILNLMFKALSPRLQVEGFTLFNMKVEQMTVITDIDDKTKHGIMRIRFHINN